MWILKSVDAPDTEPFTFRLTSGVVKTMGRAVRSDFVVDAPLVSRFHCRLTVSDADSLEVEDLESTNGTFVNDTRITRVRLEPGDRLRVGRVEFAVERAS